MKPLWTGRRPEIIYFEESERESHTTLKRFLTYLKMKKVTAPIRFAFIDERGPLIPNLSLRENISLDSIPSTISSDKEFSLEDYLHRRGNTSLTQLYQNINLLEDLPSQVDSQTLKIASLIKGLLQDGQYLFLENPERFLNQQNLQLFTHALLHQLSERNQTLLLKSSNPSLWNPFITQWIKEKVCPSTGRVILSDNQQAKAFVENILPFKQTDRTSSEDTTSQKQKKSNSDINAA